MPTIYHDNCGKPGPKSNDYIPPPDARLFKSRSAPNSPMLVRQTLFPPRTPRTHDRSPASPRLRRAATLFVEKRKIEKTEKTESKSKEIKSEQKWKIGRSRSFNNKSEQKNSLGKVWHPGCLRCEECGKRLNPGQHSEHRGIPYCNIPCYSMLFGPGGFGHGGTESHTNYGQEKTNSEELEALRNEIIPKLKAYNTYFKDQKASQLSSKEVNGRIILEGVLKVYWGLKNPVTLGNHRLGDWRRQSHRGSKSQTTEKNVGIKTKAAVGKENITQSQSAQRPRSTSIEKILARRRSIERQQSRNNSVGNDKKEQSFSLFNGRRLRRQTSFTPPHGTSTNLRLTSRIPTREVVKMLLAKFQITDNPNKFNIYARYDNGAIRRLNKNEYPLLCRLLLGANEEIVKLYIMGSDDTNDISEEVAQYIHFSLPVLEAFLKKFKEEEEREVEKIKERYGQYRALLQKRLSEISTSV